MHSFWDVYRQMCVCVIKKVLHYNAHIAKASVFVFVRIDNGDARVRIMKIAYVCLKRWLFWPHICPVIQAICFDPINFRTKLFNYKTCITQQRTESQASVENVMKETFVRLFDFFFAIWQLLYKIDMHEL